MAGTGVLSERFFECRIIFNNLQLAFCSAFGDSEYAERAENTGMDGKFVVIDLRLYRIQVLVCATYGNVKREDRFDLQIAVKENLFCDKVDRVCCGALRNTDG